MLGSFYKDGIDRGEKAAHIVDPENREEHLKRLAEAGIDVQKMMDTGQLEVVPWTDVYVRDHRFDQDAMLTAVEKLIQSGTAAGYPLTRLVGHHMDWLFLDKPATYNLVEYEARLNHVLSKYDDPVICNYNPSKFGATVAMDILRTHPLVIIGGLLRENPYFVSPEQFLDEMRERRPDRKTQRSELLKMVIDQSAEIFRLRATVRDLLALSIIPEAWVAREPAVIAADLADLLIGSLKLDFAFVRLCDPTGYQSVEVIRGECWKGFPEWLQQRFVRFGQVSRTEIVTNVGGVEKSCRGVVIPIGVNSERGLIAAACDRSEFPDQIDQQLLSVAANNAATAFQNARLIDELRTAQKALRDQEQELRKAHDELEIKVAERTSELRTSERELRDVIDAIPTIAWSALPDGSNTYINKGFAEYSGLSAEQAAGSGWQAATHFDDLQQHLSKWMASVATGEPFENEVRFRRADGQYRWHLCRGVPLRDHEERIVKWYGILFDIDELKKTECALQEREHELLGIIDTIPSLLWSAAPTGEPTHLSKRVLEYSGLHFEDFLDLGWKRFIHPDDYEETARVFFQAIQKGESYNLFHRLRRADGEYRWHHARGEPLRGPHGEIVQWYGLAVDIDEWKRAEDHLRDTRTKD